MKTTLAVFGLSLTVALAQPMIGPDTNHNHPVPQTVLILKPLAIDPTAVMNTTNKPVIRAVVPTAPTVTTLAADFAPNLVTNDLISNTGVFVNGLYTNPYTHTVAQAQFPSLFLVPHGATSSIAGLTAYIIVTTNASLPKSNWTRLATPYTNRGGTMTAPYTNPTAGAVFSAGYQYKGWTSNANQ